MARQPKTFDVALTADIGWMPVNPGDHRPGEIRATSEQMEDGHCVSVL